MTQQTTGRPILVFAANYDEYARWCYDNSISPKNGHSQFMSGPEQMYGHGRVEVEFLSTPLWWTEDDEKQLGNIMERSR